MVNILVNSKKDSDQISDLLSKSLPSYRQAYSDRTAWVMACLSELAYVKFNPFILTEKRKEFLTKNILESFDNKKEILKCISSLGYDHKEEYEQLEKEIKILGMEIVETFDCNGTQAILVSYDDYIVLAFRGTESTSIKDIKADAKAWVTSCPSGGKIHSGFNDAFNEIATDIQTTLNEPRFSNLPLFITGHSLGGALATVATKKLSHPGNIAACYTFGSPRVGNDEWIGSIKSPIFRVVNAADCVTMLPPGGDFISACAGLLNLIAKIQIPFLSLLCAIGVQKLSLKLGDYLHCGDMRYLTNCPMKGDYENVQLLPAVSSFYRIINIKDKIFMKKFLADHAISIYRKKLMVVATRRNP